MSTEFLSQDWFDQVNAMREAHPEIEVPPELAALTFNVTVPDAPRGDFTFHVSGGEMTQGAADNAPIAVTAPYEVAYKMIVKGDNMAIAAAFMRGKVKVRGDLKKLKVLAGGGMDGLRAILEEITTPVKG